MKFKIIAAAIIIIVFSSAGMAMAASGTQNGKTNNSMPGMDMSGSSSSSMSGMDMNGSSSSSMSGMDMNGSSNSSMSGSNSADSMPGMDMGGGPVKETPPNMKVLGTYGAVNLVFIIIGIWNKWFRRKGGLNVSSK